MYSHKLNISVTHLIESIATPNVRAFFKPMEISIDSSPTVAEYQRIFSTVLPKLKALWHSYFDTYGFDVMVTPATPAPARPIYDTLPLTEINGRREYQYSGEPLLPFLV